MQKKLIAVALCLVAVAACKKKEEPAPAADTAATSAPALAPQPAPAPKTATPQPTVTLAAGAPIPAQGVALWLAADDAQPGKLASWSNSAVAGVTATASKPEEQPEVVANAINGHKVVRFNGEQTMLMTSIDISPARMPEATVFAVFSSQTDKPAPLRKLYGDDNGSYDRAAGLDNRAENHNYTVFGGSASVIGYFDLKPNETYITADQFTKSDFTGWVNGKKMLDKVAATWGDKPDEALPNMYIGNTGTSYDEHWQGDLAEIIVYARVLSDQERMQVEDYLAKRYGVTLTR